MSNTLLQIKKHLQTLADPQKAAILARFFKTGKGEYAAGDKFIGITVPVQRQVATKFSDQITLAQTEKLLQDKIHECRLTALFILIRKFESARDEVTKKEIFDLYCRNLKYVNNWDLVDSSAPKIVGAYLLNRPRQLLYRLTRSKHLWSERAAIIATFTFIRNKDFTDTLKLAEILIEHPHDLIHKAVGWMLREVGNRDRQTEIDFLEKHHKAMPRTMLRYAIEKFPEKLRLSFLKSPGQTSKGTKNVKTHLKTTKTQNSKL